MVAFACGSGNSGAPGVLGGSGGGDSGTVIDSTAQDSSAMDSGPVKDATSHGEGGACSDAGEAGLSLCNNLCTNLLTDVDNCGACGHKCVACASGTCQAAVIASAGAPIFDIAVNSTDVWWTQPATMSSSGALLSKHLASGMNIVTVVSNLPDPRGIALGVNKVFWVDYINASVDEADLTTVGGAFTTDWPPPAVDGSASSVHAKPIDVALDSSNIYWVANGTGDVLSIPRMNQGNVSPTVIASGQDNPYAIAVYGGNVFWANLGSSTNPPNGSVMQTATTGGGAIITLASSQAEPFDIVADANNVYWVDNANPGTVNQVPVGGGNVITLAQGEGAPYGIAVDSTSVYWTSFSDNTVNAVPIGGGDGGAKRVYASGQSGPAAITVDATNIYWVNQSAQTIVEVTK